MPRERDLHLDEYEISKARYRELLYKCRQYPESKYKRDECYGISAMTLKMRHYALAFIVVSFGVDIVLATISGVVREAVPLLIVKMSGGG